MQEEVGFCCLETTMLANCCWWPWSEMRQPRCSIKEQSNLTNLRNGCYMRSLRSISEAALLKLSWDMLTSNNHWSVLLKSRFMRLNRPLGHYAKSSIWPGVRQFINTTIDGCCWLLGNGKSVNFWRDCWLDVPLSVMLHPLMLCSPI